MSDKDIATRQSDLQDTANTLVKERTGLSQRISEINAQIEQLKGAHAELERQKTDTPKKESPVKDEVKK